MSTTPNPPGTVEEIRRYFIVNPINRHYSSKVRHQVLPNVQNYTSTNISPHRRYGSIRHDSIHSYTSLLRLSLNYNRHRRFNYWYNIEGRRNSATNRRLIGYHHVPYQAISSHIQLHEWVGHHHQQCHQQWIWDIYRKSCKGYSYLRKEISEHWDRCKGGASFPNCTYAQ